MTVVGSFDRADSAVLLELMNAGHRAACQTRPSLARIVTSSVPVIDPSPLVCHMESPSRHPRLQRNGPGLETARAICAHRDFVSGFCFQPPNLVPVKYEVHLPQSALGSFADGVRSFPSSTKLAFSPRVCRQTSISVCSKEGFIARSDSRADYTPDTPVRSGSNQVRQLI